MRHPEAHKTRLYAAVGRELTSHREAAGLSIEALAKRTGISRSQLFKVEDGAPCPLHMLVALADVYDCTIDELVPVLVDARAVA